MDERGDKVQKFCRAPALVVLLLLLVTCGSNASPVPLAQRPTFTAVVPSKEPLSTTVPPPSDARLGLPDQVRVTIVYDNTAYRQGLAAEWGFAAWIEYGEHTILFDTGPEGAALLDNMAQLDLNPQDIDAVVLSHIHGDHVGGVDALLKTGIQPVVYAPVSFPDSFEQDIRAHTELVEVLDPVEIFPGLHSTGQLGGGPAEQALVAETSAGMVVITGCAHPGILRIVRQAQALVAGEIALVMGGFHLAGTDPTVVDHIVDTFREVGVKQVCPTHCTGERAMEKFAVEYGEDYLEGGAGRVLIVGSAQTYWPTGGWRASVPVGQRVDSATLALMLAQNRHQDCPIRQEADPRQSAGARWIRTGNRRFRLLHRIGL
jgi:7,8-dihydropterin-6-yl-methyl-4-(beta-D-ribofuranosyl)aminobenzene 5'-phosphate synthase